MSSSTETLRIQLLDNLRLQIEIILNEMIEQKMLLPNSLSAVVKEDEQETIVDIEFDVGLDVEQLVIELCPTLLTVISDLASETHVLLRRKDRLDYLFIGADFKEISMVCWSTKIPKGLPLGEARGQICQRLLKKAKAISLDEFLKTLDCDVKVGEENSAKGPKPKAGFVNGPIMFPASLRGYFVFGVTLILFGFIALSVQVISGLENVILMASPLLVSGCGFFILYFVGGRAHEFMRKEGLSKPSH